MFMMKWCWVSVFAVDIHHHHHHSERHSPCSWRATKSCYLANGYRNHRGGSDQRLIRFLSAGPSAVLGPLSLQAVGASSRHGSRSSPLRRFCLSFFLPSLHVIMRLLCLCGLSSFRSAWWRGGGVVQVLPIWAITEVAWCLPGSVLFTSLLFYSLCTKDGCISCSSEVRVWTFQVCSHRFILKVKDILLDQLGVITSLLE